MTEIHNLKELNELGRDLKILDQIYFTTKYTIIKYYITKQFLACDKHSGDYIFNYLNLNNKKTYKLAEKCYRYRPTGELWPRYKPNDYSAAERLIREIYKRLGDNILESHKFSMLITPYYGCF